MGKKPIGQQAGKQAYKQTRKYTNMQTYLHDIDVNCSVGTLLTLARLKLLLFIMTSLFPIETQYNVPDKPDCSNFPVYLHIIFHL